MNRILFRIAPAALIVAALAPRSVSAQNPDSIKQRNDCRLAAQVIGTGHPEPHTEWAWAQIGYCDPRLRVRVLAIAMQQARTATELSQIRRAMLAPVGIRDGQLFEILLEIAGDKTASVPARVVAFVALAAIRDPTASPSYEHFTGGVTEYPGGVIVPRARCSARLSHERGFHAGPTPLPADYLQRIEELSERVSRDSAEPPDVRSAAACV